MSRECVYIRFAKMKSFVCVNEKAQMRSIHNNYNNNNQMGNSQTLWFSFSPSLSLFSHSHPLAGDRLSIENKWAPNTASSQHVKFVIHSIPSTSSMYQTNLENGIKLPACDNRKWNRQMRRKNRTEITHTLRHSISAPACSLCECVVLNGRTGARARAISRHYTRKSKVQNQTDISEWHEREKPRRKKNNNIVCHFWNSLFIH